MLRVVATVPQMSAVWAEQGHVPKWKGLGFRARPGVLTGEPRGFAESGVEDDTGALRGLFACRL